MSGIAIDVFLWADPDISIALVPSTESLGDFCIGFWDVVENKLKHRFMTPKRFVQQDNLHRQTLLFLKSVNEIARSKKLILGLKQTTFMS